MPRLVKLSASSISTFKSCPMRYYISYVLKLRPDRATEAQRMGTNWHRILEIYNLEGGQACPDCLAKPDRAECPICNKTGVVPDGGMDAVVRYLNYAYRETPVGIEKEVWEVERIKLLYSLIAYLKYHEKGLLKYKVVNQERNFSIALQSPKSGKALPKVQIDGKIDKELVDADGIDYIMEHKSTSSPIGSDSSYWGHLRLDTQSTLYPYVMFKLTGKLYSVLYDVWHKPQIKPKKLSQSDSKKFVEDGMYCGTKFGVTANWESNMDTSPSIVVSGIYAEFEFGAKEGTFAIRETPEMYGARLLKEISDNPSKYFVLKPIPRTMQDIEKFEKSIFNIYHTIRSMERSEAWFVNEKQCEATFKCSYTDFCYNECVPKPGEVPAGFKCTLRKEYNEK